MTPYEIGVVLHYYAHVDDHPRLKDDPDTITKFLSDGILERGPVERQAPTFVITDRGTAFCEALKQVPLPVQRWVTVWPEGLEI